MVTGSLRINEETLKLEIMRPDGTAHEISDERATAVALIFLAGRLDKMNEVLFATLQTQQSIIMLLKDAKDAVQ